MKKQAIMKFVVCVLAAACLSAVAGIRASADDIRVSVDGVPVFFAGQQPTIVEDRTLVPVRGVFEHLGFEVGWIADAQQITLSSSDHFVAMSIGRANFVTNGVMHTMDVPPQIINDSTMVPIRAVLESVGHSVGWDDATRTVLITRGLPGVMSPVLPPPANQNDAAVAAPVPPAPPAPPAPQTDDRLAPFVATQSSIALPDYRRQTNAERQEWVAEYQRMGGPSAFELEIVQLTNEIRLQHGLNPLQIDNSLMMAARFYAQTMATFEVLGHGVGPYGGSGEVVRSFGASNTGWRNGFAINATPQRIVDGWMDSPGHRANILVPSTTHIGVGSQFSQSGRVFHYQVFTSEPVTNIMPCQDEAAAAAAVREQAAAARAYAREHPLNLSHFEFTVIPSLPSGSVLAPRDTFEFTVQVTNSHVVNGNVTVYYHRGILGNMERSSHGVHPERGMETTRRFSVPAQAQHGDVIEIEIYVLFQNERVRSSNPNGYRFFYTVNRPGN